MLKRAAFVKVAPMLTSIGYVQSNLCGVILTPRLLAAMLWYGRECMDMAGPILIKPVINNWRWSTEMNVRDICRVKLML